MTKTYTIISTRRNAESTTTGTLEALIEAFGYTLVCGASYQNEKGNKKINQHPKSAKSLVDNLNKAKTNSAANGNPDTTYSLQ